MAKQPLTEEERQDFIDNLQSLDQVNSNAVQTFDKAITRTALPKQSKPKTLEQQSDGYSDTRTHSDTGADTSATRSDTFQQLSLSGKLLLNRLIVNLILTVRDRGYM